MRSQVHILPLLALLLLAACAGPAEAGDGGDSDCTLTPLAFYDPLTQAGAVRDVHDPALIKQGDHHYLVHHFYDAEEGGVPKLQGRSLLWGEDGWPLAGEPYDTEPGTWGGAAMVR